MCAAELTALLAAARILPAGFTAEPVGVYPPLTFVHRFAHEWWATADLVDVAGRGHLEIAVGVRGALPDRPLEHLGDGVHTWQVAAPGGVLQLCAMLLREDGAYLTVSCCNESSRTAGPTRPAPPLAPVEVLRLLSAQE